MRTFKVRTGILPTTKYCLTALGLALKRCINNFVQKLVLINYVHPHRWGRMGTKYKYEQERKYGESVTLYEPLSVQDGRYVWLNAVLIGCVILKK